jgi:hypothetical protein
MTGRYCTESLANIGGAECYHIQKTILPYMRISNFQEQFLGNKLLCLKGSQFDIFDSLFPDVLPQQNGNRAVYSFPVV